MNKLFVTTPVALALAAVFGSAYGDDYRRGQDPHDVGVNVTVKNDAAISLRTSQEIHNDYVVTGTGKATGIIVFRAEASALVDTKQITGPNPVWNNFVDNDAIIGASMQNANGNIGANVAAGDNNQQANDAALSSLDAAFVFTAAQTYSVQKNSFTVTNNTGTSNNAAVFGAGALAKGNIGVNVAAGNSNQQANLLAASVDASSLFEKAPSSVAKASTFGLQDAINNTTWNNGRPDNPHRNMATMSGSAFASASGNIGVNIAAGTNHMQRNSLAISSGR